MHPEKSQIIALRNGLCFVGYRIFYYHKLLRKRNIAKFVKSFEKRLKLYKDGLLSYNLFLEQLQGWFGYAQWANTYKFKKRIIKKVDEF